MDEVREKLEIKMKYTARREHENKAKHNIYTIDKRIHVNVHNLTCKATPRVILRYMAMVSIKQPNCIPAKVRVYN